MEMFELIIWSTVFTFMQSPPTASVTVTTKQPLVQVHENEDAVLSCEFQTQADHQPRIEWKKRDKTDIRFIYFQGKFLEDLAGRATIKGATVTIQKVTQLDAGVYRCEVSTSQDVASLGETNVTLQVLVPPNTPRCEIPSSALTGTRVTLRCWDRQSIPPATYSWYKDSKQLSVSHAANATYLLDPGTGTLETVACVSCSAGGQVLKSVSHGDTGLYHCEASNGVGVPKSCKGGHIHIDDLNLPAIVGAVVVICLLFVLCTLAGFYAHRQGYFSQAHRGRSFWISQCHGVTHMSSQNLHRPDDTSNTSYMSPPKDIQDFKHTQSFVL